MNTDPGRGTYYLKRASQQDARQFHTLENSEEKYYLKSSQHLGKKYIQTVWTLPWNHFWMKDI